MFPLRAGIRRKTVLFACNPLSINSYSIDLYGINLDKCSTIMFHDGAMVISYPPPS